ncbi:MAG: hypothetical protein JRG91_05045 [Deltaproteobacteria bacterium]|nr:hypothetical protein [Deltaproteobacteria bacterium]
MGERPIPSRLVFIWFGSRLPVTARVAVRSAMSVCRPDETLIVHQGLESGQVKDLVEAGARLVPAGREWFEGLPEGGDTAMRLYDDLASPASRANLLRLAVLWRKGGVYMDTDTITLRDLDDLRRFDGFCGLEPVALPGDLFGSPNPARWLAAGVRLAVREGCVRLGSGVDVFRRLERYYASAVNNAVLGSRPGNPIIARAFAEIGRMASSMRGRRYRLGTHLLQRLTLNRSGPDMRVLPSAYFYPLGPEISAHWFREGSASRLDAFLRPETRVVHWYSSVEERVGLRWIDEDYIRTHAGRTAFARLASAHLE